MKSSFLLIGILLFASADGFAQLPSDGQIWTSVDFVIGIKKEKDKKGKEFDRIALNLTGIDRFGDSFSRPVDQRLGMFLDFRVNKFLTITPGYLYQKASPLKTGQNYESRLSIAANLNRRWKDWNFKTRQQIEHKFRNGRQDNQNYRPLFQINYFVKRKKKDLLSPFVSNEGYYDTLAKTWSRNEFRAGASRALNKRLSADFFYIRVDTRPVNVNGFGIGLKVKLR
jgi:hypothetical protein